MKNVYKFEDYDTYVVSSKVLIDTFGLSANTKVDHPFSIQYRSRENELFVPIPKRIEIDAKNTVNISSLLNTVTDFTFEDKIYLHSNCAIPRAKVTQKYTRVLNPDKADICVVPKLTRNIDSIVIALFVNRDKNKIYIIEPSHGWVNGNYICHTPEKCTNYPMGSGVLDINPSLRGTYIEERTYYSAVVNSHSMENWKDFLASTLIYCGPTAILYTKEFWIADIMYNKLHDVITEDRLLTTLGDSNNEFTEEAYNNLKEMLNSSDETVVGLGLKAVAEMNYEKYRNTTIHLLSNNNRHWDRNAMKTCASVKYMLEYLNLWRCSREYYADSTTQEDFVLMQKVINNDFEDRIENLKNSFKSRFPFVNLSLEYSFKISPKLDEEEESSDE